MIPFIVGFMVGGFVGFVMCALLVMARDPEIGGGF